jgi:hypothetical protein
MRARLSQIFNASSSNRKVGSGKMSEGKSLGISNRACMRRWLVGLNFNPQTQILNSRAYALKS